MRISDWSSDVCSSDLVLPALPVIASRKPTSLNAALARCVATAIHAITKSWSWVCVALQPAYTMAPASCRPAYRYPPQPSACATNGYLFCYAQPRKYPRRWVTKPITKSVPGIGNQHLQDFVFLESL